ncbi:hypothetical protein [Novosphingobium sp. FSW06-99]|uniref:hypothetical protein n=1 Tax=Novosphingobium sp. FSW06-99 TaxID=1739113 RepID=UPI00076D15FB|nr:hypothetical protein [Novosphingobium sp. FSW06-99]KUR74099.1 hypothetical protein AQZ49_19370 [Novosphingobium sp. FSW06-99]
MTLRARFMIAVVLGLAALPVGATALGGWFVPVVEPVPTAQALGHDLADDDWYQVQIEQHLIIRITPGNPALLRASPPVPRPLPEHLRQRRTGQCLPVAGIAGVRPLANNRLLLFMRDRRLIGADLSRNCTARDFYLGFYVTSTDDGQLCAGRDTIHSRAGTTCTISEVHELVPTN